VLELARVGGYGLDRGAPDLGLQVGGRAFGDDAPEVDDPHPVGKRVGLLQVLGGEKDRDAVVSGEAGDLVPQGRPALDVEPGRRLVEEQQPRLVQQRQCQVEPALHPARVAAHAAIGGIGQADPFQERVATSLDLGERQAVQASLEAHVLTPRQQGVERSILEGDADHVPHRGPLSDDVVATHAGGARGGGQQGGQHVDGRRLAGPVGAQEAVDLAGRHLEVDAVDGARAVLELAYEVLDLDPVFVRDRHSASFPVPSSVGAIRGHAR
jgi:hypothetical protein